MSHIRIDTNKAIKKWTPILENMGVTPDRVEWMSEYAEYHSINENAYVNATNVAGMGAILNPVIGTLAGNPGNFSNAYGNVAGSGDVGQNLLPVAMKIAAQTIGLDLVAVKPSPGPKIDLLYIDFRYDDVNTTSNERPQVFKIVSGTTGLAVAQAQLSLIITAAGGRQNQEDDMASPGIAHRYAAALSAGQASVGSCGCLGSRHKNNWIWRYGLLHPF